MCINYELLCQKNVWWESKYYFREYYIEHPELSRKERDRLADLSSGENLPRRTASADCKDSSTIAGKSST